MSKEKITILGHPNPDVDSIVSGILLEHYINNYTIFEGEFVIPDEKIDKTTADICKRYKIKYKSHQRKLTKSDKSLVLVDHNKTEYTDKKILAVIDHHPTNSPTLCNRYQNIKIASTALEIVKDRETYFNKDLLRLAVLATLVDTASFNSNKGKDEDKAWVDDMIRIFDFDREDLYETGLHLTNLDNLNESAFELLKKYEIADKKVASSVIQIIPENNKVELKKMKDLVINYFFQNDLDIYLFIVHDMKNLKTTVYKIYPDKIDIDKYDSYTSRGNTIIPNLEKELKRVSMKTPKSLK